MRELKVEKKRTLLFIAIPTERFPTGRSIIIPTHRQNVVLQSKLAEYDGSLSIYCQSVIPHINVEAQYGHLAEKAHASIIRKTLSPVEQHRANATWS